jgi:hypothetical protein
MNQQDEARAREELVAAMYTAVRESLQEVCDALGFDGIDAPHVSDQIMSDFLDDFARLAGLLGWSRPRVVETETESGALEALWTMPVGATIECGSGMLWRKVSTGMYGWVGTGVSHHCQPEVFMRDTPLTVLHLPEETS